MQFTDRDVYSVGTVLLSAVLLGFMVVALHGATRVPDDLFIDDSQVNQSSSNSDDHPCFADGSESLVDSKRRTNWTSTNSIRCLT